MPPLPDPLPQGERELHKIPLLCPPKADPPQAEWGSAGEGDDVNSFNSFAIA